MEDEATTRKRQINLRLRAAGWTVTRYSSEPAAASPPDASAVEERPTVSGPRSYT